MDFVRFVIFYHFFPQMERGSTVQRTDRHGKQTGPVSFFFAAVYD